MAQMKEQIKAPEKSSTKWRRDRQPLKRTVQNTGNQDAHRNDWVRLQNKGRSEVCAKENEKYTGNQEWREGNWDSNQWLGAEEINIQPEENDETRIQENEERLRNLHDNLKHSNIWIVGVPEGEKKNKRLKTYLNK